MRKCPLCAKKIRDDEIKCKRCGEMLDKDIISSKSKKVRAKSGIEDNAKIGAKSSIEDGAKISFGMFVVLPLLIIGMLLVLLIVFGVI